MSENVKEGGEQVADKHRKTTPSLGSRKMQIKAIINTTTYRSMVPERPTVPRAGEDIQRTDGR